MAGSIEEDIVEKAAPVLARIRAALALPREERPLAEENEREDTAATARIDFSLAFLKGKGLAEGIDPGLIASRAELAALVREGAGADPARHRLLRGWRGVFIGNELLKLLGGEIAIRIDPKTGWPSATACPGGSARP